MYSYIIVDDEFITRKGILKKVESFSLPMIFLGEADNGEDALELVTRVIPDIVITDMNMPTMDGVKFLKELHNRYPSIKVIIISGYTDFVYMQEAITSGAITYLLKPFTAEELGQAFHKAIVQLDEAKKLTNKIQSYEEIQTNNLYQNDIHLLSKIIHNTYSNHEIFFESTLLQGLNLFKYYQLMTLYTNEVNDIKQFQIYFQNSILKDSFICFHNDISHHIIFIVYFYNSDNFTLNTMTQLIKNLYIKLNHNIYAGISKRKTSLLELNQASRETINALNSSKIANAHNYSCFLYDDVSIKQPLFHWEKSDELLFFMERGDLENVSTILTDLFHNFTSSETITFEQLKSFCGSLIMETRAILRRYFDSVSTNSLSSSYDTIIDTLFEINEIQNYYTLLFMNITTMLASNNIYTNENIVNRIKIYIQYNYNKTLTLDKISSLFFINASYCSTLFKEKTGNNFIDYVNQIRIEKAKDLLLNTNDKIYHIAKSVGYDNSKYFFRIFKKITGQTPENYRKLQSK